MDTDPRSLDAEIARVRVELSMACTPAETAVLRDRLEDLFVQRAGRTTALRTKTA